MAGPSTHLSFEAQQSWVLAATLAASSHNSQPWLFEVGIDAKALRRLERAATGRGVTPILITDDFRKATIAEWVAAGNRAQLEDQAWRKELTAWLRFNEREARRLGDGLWSRTTGNPNVPRWLGRAGLPFFLNARAQNGRDVPWTLGSAGIIVLVSDENDIEHWVEVGRCYERFALEATVLGLCNTFINQPVEVPHLRDEFAAWLGLGNCRPDLVVRFGYGPSMPRAPRRPLSEVLVPLSSKQPTADAPPCHDRN